MDYQHFQLAIAQIVFYSLVIPPAGYLLFLRHKRPRLTWVFLFLFALLRIAGGILVIVQHNQPSSDFKIPINNIFRVGIVPLLISTLGFVKIILALDFTPQSRLFYIIKVIRVLLLAVFGLLIPGGIIGGLAQNESSVNLGLALIKAACCVAVVILALLLGFQAYFWTFYKDLCSDSIIILKRSLGAVPFLVVRVVFSFLGAFDSSNSMWNIIDGSIAVYVAMALVMEYLVVVIYIVGGFKISPVQRSDKVKYYGEVQA